MILEHFNPRKSALAIGAAWLLLKGLQRLIFSVPVPPKGASVFITGAGTGIGRATALLLNEKGFKVFAGTVSQEEIVELKSASKFPENLIGIICDVTSPESIAAARLVIERAGGNLHGLVNNAGINAATGPVEMVPMDLVRKTMEVNLFGVYHTLQGMLPLVRAARGRVVNIASINGFFTWQDHTSYCASKHGVEALTDGLRLEMDPLGVSVSVVEPGGIRTPIWEGTIRMIEICGRRMGPEFNRVYGTYDVEKSMEGLKHVRLSEPRVVAEAIYHALSSPLPKHRYTIGAMAGTMALLRRYILSDFLFHAFVRKFFKGSRVPPPRPQ